MKRKYGKTTLSLRGRGLAYWICDVSQIKNEFFCILIIICCKITHIYAILSHLKDNDLISEGALEVKCAVNISGYSPPQIT